MIRVLFLVLLAGLGAQAYFRLDSNWLHHPDLFRRDSPPRHRGPNAMTGIYMGFAFHMSDCLGELGLDGRYPPGLTDQEKRAYLINMACQYRQQISECFMNLYTPHREELGALFLRRFGVDMPDWNLGAAANAYSYMCQNKQLLISNSQCIQEGLKTNYRAGGCTTGIFSFRDLANSRPTSTEQFLSSVCGRIRSGVQCVAETTSQCNPELERYYDEFVDILTAGC